MEEKRKSIRSELSARLIIKRLDGEKTDETVDIDIEDLSKTGIGFYCSQALISDAVYEAYITIWTKEVIHAFIEIVRIEKKGDTFVYGAIFVGMSTMEAARIETYQTVEAQK